MLSVEATECKPLSERIKNVEANYIMQSGRWILSAYQFSGKWDNENNAVRRNLDAWVRPALRFVHHTVRTRTQFFTRKGLGTFFVYRRFCDESTQSGKRARAGYHCDGGILPFVLRDQVRLVRTWSPPYMAHWGQSLHTCVPGRACTPLARCNTLDFVPKSVC